MIRINLLPVKAAQRRASGLRQVLIGSVVLVITIALTFLFHGLQVASLNEQKAQIKKLEGAIKLLKQEIGDYDAIRAQREALLRQKQAIEKLQSARSGPAFLMREMSDILTKGKGPSVDPQQYDKLLQQEPSAGYNPAWEPKRAWLLSFVEKDRVAAIRGAAKSGEDVSEFCKRLKLSAYFNEVYWQQTQPQTDARLNNVQFVTFDVKARVEY